MWDDQGPGMPVCFTWLDWLQACALEHLGIRSTLFLLPVAAAQTGLQEMQLGPTDQSPCRQRSSFTGTQDVVSSSADVQQGSFHRPQPGSQLQHISDSPASAAQPAASRKSLLETLGAVALQNGNSHDDPSHVSGQAAGELPESSCLGLSLADNGRAADVSAAEAFAAADALLGHLLRYDAMQEWDRYTATPTHASLLAKILHR